MALLVRKTTFIFQKSVNYGISGKRRYALAELLYSYIFLLFL